MSVVASMDFLAKSDIYLDEKPYRLKFDPPADLARSNIQVDSREQVVEDIRGREAHFSIEENGFCLVPFDVEMSYEDYDDEQKIKQAYLPKVANVLQVMLGASRVQIFEHLVRQHEYASRAFDL